MRVGGGCPQALPVIIPGLNSQYISSGKRTPPLGGCRRLRPTSYFRWRETTLNQTAGHWRCSCCCLGGLPGVIDCLISAVG